MSITPLFDIASRKDLELSFIIEWYEGGLCALANERRCEGCAPIDNRALRMRDVRATMDAEWGASDGLSRGVSRSVVLRSLRPQRQIEVALLRARA